MATRFCIIIVLFYITLHSCFAAPQESKQANIIKLKIELQEAQLAGQSNNPKLAAQLSNSYEDYLLGYCIPFLLGGSSNHPILCKEYLDKLAHHDPGSPFVICYNSKYLGEACQNSYNSIKLTTVPDGPEIAKFKSELDAIYLTENSYTKLPNPETQSTLVAEYEATLPKICKKIRFVRELQNPKIRVREIPSTCYSLLERGNKLLPGNKIITCYIAGRLSPSCRALTKPNTNGRGSGDELIQVF